MLSLYLNLKFDFTRILVQLDKLYFFARISFILNLYIFSDETNKA